jgi:hypothetical protein
MAISPKKLVLIVLFYSLLGVLIRWPTMPYIYTLPLESNTPLHALAALGLCEGHLLNLPYLGWPEGAQVRYIAWPLLLITGICNLFISPIPAMNLGVFLWIVGQGLGGYYFGTKLQFSKMGALICGVICMCSPSLLQANGNGQFENISMMSLLWLYWALEESVENIKYRWMHIGVAFALTLFSSPYQGVVGLLMIGVHLLYTYQWKITLPILPSLLIGAWYYGAVSQGEVHASVIPAQASIAETARIYGFFIPQNIAENGGVPLMGPLGRLHNLVKLPTNMIYSNRWPWMMSTATDYISVVLLISGGYGLWKIKNKKLWTMLVVFIVISLGQKISVGNILTIPLPWKLSVWIPGIQNMQATLRFLSGVSLVLGIALCHSLSSKKWSGIILFLLLFDFFLISPHNWPIQAYEPILSPQLKEMKTQNKPIAYWPSAPIIASHKVTTTALVLQLPLATFHHPKLAMPNETGDINNQLFLDDAKTWLHKIKEQDIDTLLQFRDMVGSQSQPFFSHYEQCDEYYCTWNLTEE